MTHVFRQDNRGYHFVSGERCPPEARKAYVDAVARLNKEGRSQAVVYMPGHVDMSLSLGIQT